MEDKVSDTSESANAQEVVTFDDRNNNIKLYFSSLISIFPNVDSEYIRQICMKPPFELSKDNDPLVMFINHLISYNEHVEESYISELERLENIISEKLVDDDEILRLQNLELTEIKKQNEDELYEELVPEFLQKDQETINAKLDILINILPDANPQFLRDFIENNYDDTLALQQFVESSLIDKNYEKRDIYYAKRQIKKNIEQYTINFSVEKFIKRFPEPFEHFESNGKKGNYQEKAINFLQSRHNSFPEQYLSNIYTANKYNLSLADKEILSANNVPPIVPDNFDTDDILLLQEITFIRHKNSIKLYLDDIKQREEKELQELRAKKLLLECQCCFDELKPTECIECDDNHIFCMICVIRGTNEAIADGQISVECFVCNKEINLNVLRKVLPKYTFEMLLKKRQEFEVQAAQLDDLMTCPFCPYQMELASQIKIFICKNPECMKITCRFCKRMNHLPSQCKDVLDDEAGRLLVEEEMTKALIRNCYNCQKPFVKLSGCNMMICYCRAIMCYMCRQPITGYDHFNLDGTCALWQNSELYDQQQVQLRRVQTTSKLLNNFPDIKVPDLS